MMALMELTPQIVRDRAYAARVSINKVIREAGIAGSTFYRWAGSPEKEVHPLTLAKIDDALRKFEAERAS